MNPPSSRVLAARASAARSRHALHCALTAMAALVLASCAEAPAGPRFVGAGAESPTYGGTFTFFMDTNVRSLDPQVAYDAVSNTGVRLIFDGLLDYDHDAKLIPSLAEEVPTRSADGLTYRFRLRRGVHFHDAPIFPGGRGRELVADDVRFTLERMLHPDTHSGGAFFYGAIDGVAEYQAGRSPHVRGIRVVNDHTLDITLSKPDQTFLNAMAMPFAYPVPHETYEAHPEEASFYPVGTGPFRFEGWERGVKLTFTKNPRYWQPGKPYVDRMVFLENLSRDVAAMRFRNGDLDHMHHTRQPDYIFFSTSEAWAPYVSAEPDVVIWGFFMNCEMAPFDNLHVRRAVAHAVDRARWARVYKGKLLPTGQIIPPQLAGYDPNLPNAQRFDLAKAKEEMRLAGFPDGLPAPVTVWITEGESAKSQGELLQSDLAKIGIRVELKPVSFTTYLTESGKPGRVPMALSGWSQDFPDPSNFLDIMLHSKAIHPQNSENRSFYRNPKLDALLDAARGEADPEKRTAMYREANDLVAYEAPWVFIYNYIEFQVSQPYVRNYRPNPVFTYDYKFVWLDLPRRRAD